MPAPSYIDRVILKDALKRKQSDESADNLLDIALNGAASAIYRKTGNRRFDKTAGLETRLLPTRGRLVWDRDWGEFRLAVPDIAEAAGLLVESETGGTVYPAAVVEPLDGEPIMGLRLSAWPDRVRVTAIWGWPEVPGDIRQAQLLQAMRYYRRKDSPEGIAGSAEWGLVRVPRLDPDVAEMVEDYCLPAIG